MSKQTKGEDIIVVKDKEGNLELKDSVEMPKEYWATNSPYIDAYIRALNYANYEPIETEYAAPTAVSLGEERPRATAPAQKATAPAAKKAKKVKIAKVYKRRKLSIALLAVVMLACLVVAGLGILTPVAKYVAPFARVGEDGKLASISFLDPVFSLVKTFTAKKAPETTPKAAAAVDGTTPDKAATNKTISLTNFYYDDTLAALKDFQMKGASTKEIMDVVIAYAFPVLVVLFLLVCLYIFIKALVALFSKKKDKKYKFGFSWFIALILLLGNIVMGIVWNGLGMNEMKEFFTTPLMMLGVKDMTAASAVGLGLGMYIEVALLVVALIFTMFNYKRIKPGKGNAKKTSARA